MGGVQYPCVVASDAGLSLPEIDFTGRGIEGYLHHLHMDNEFIGQQKYLSTGHPYKFLAIHHKDWGWTLI
jgi:hypothetical protein